MDHGNQQPLPDAATGNSHDITLAAHTGADEDVRTTVDAAPAGDGAGPTRVEPGGRLPAAHTATDEEHELEDEHEAGLGAALREKVISLRTMQPALRLITGIAIAQLAASVLLIALHGLRLPMLEVGWSGVHVTQMPVAIFVICVVFLTVSWSFVLTGALRSQWIVRLAALGFFSWLMLFPPAPSAMILVRYGLVALLWLWGIAMWLADWQATLAHDTPASSAPVSRFASLPLVGPVVAALRRSSLAVADRVTAFSAWDQGGRAWPLPVRSFLFVLLVLTTYYGSLLWSADWGRGSGNLLFQGTIMLQIESLTFFLVPVLFLAGSDFAEIAELLASRSALLIRRGGKPWLLTSVTALVAIVILWRSLPDPSPNVGSWIRFAFGPLITAVAVAAALALALRFGRVARWPRLRISAWALIGATALSVALAGLTIAVITAHAPAPQASVGDFTVYRHDTTAPLFSLPYPAGWSEQTLSDQGPNGGTVIAFNGLTSTPEGLFTLFSASQSGATEADALSAAHVMVHAITPQGDTLTYQKAQRDGAWSAEAFTITRPDHTTALAGTSWSRVIGDRVWCLAGVTIPALVPEMRTAYASMVAQWRPDLTATVPAAPETSVSFDVNAFYSWINGVATVGLSLLIGLSLLWYARRRPGVLAVCGMFAVVFGMVALAETLPNMLSFIGLPEQRLAFLSMHIPNFQFAIAIGTLLTIGWLALRRGLGGRGMELLVALLALNVGVQIVVSLLALYDTAIAASQSSTHQPFSWAAALIVMIALGWDLAMSGEQITNREGRRFPRHVRLLLYLGYIMFVATAVLFFSSQTLAYGGGAYDAFFESEPWPQLGLQVLGVPLLLTGFLLEVSRWWAERGSREASADGEATADEAVAQPVVAGE